MKKEEVKRSKKNEKKTKKTSRGKAIGLVLEAVRSKATTASAMQSYRWCSIEVLNQIKREKKKKGKGKETRSSHNIPNKGFQLPRSSMVSS